MISVLILTLNEQQDLQDCLASVSWSDDIHVFDSYSTDSTTAIPQQDGAQVHQRPFDDYASQRNAGLRDPHFKHEWLLMLDADERVTPELRRELATALQAVDAATTLMFSVAPICLLTSCQVGFWS